MSKAGRIPLFKRRFSGRKAAFMLLGLVFISALAAWQFHFSKAPRVARYVDCIEAHRQYEDAHACMEDKELLHKIDALHPYDMVEVARSSAARPEFVWLNGFDKLPEHPVAKYFMAFDGVVAVLVSEEPADIIVIVDTDTDQIVGYEVVRE